MFPRDPNAPGGLSRAESLRQAFHNQAERFEDDIAAARRIGKTPDTITVAVRTTKGAWTTKVLDAEDPFEIARRSL